MGGGGGVGGVVVMMYEAPVPTLHRYTPTGGGGGGCGHQNVVLHIIS